MPNAAEPRSSTTRLCSLLGLERVDEPAAVDLRDARRAKVVGGSVGRALKRRRRSLTSMS